MFDYKKHSEIKTSDDPAVCLAFSPDGDNLLTSTNVNTNVLDTYTGNTLRSYYYDGFRFSGD